MPETRARDGVAQRACDQAERIMLQEGFGLIRAARGGDAADIRAASLAMARVIAAALTEAAAAEPAASDAPLLKAGGQ